MGNCKCCETQSKSNELVFYLTPQTPTISAPNSTKNKSNYVPFPNTEKVPLIEKQVNSANSEINYTSTPLIFDFGHFNTRIGLAGNEQPNFIIPTIIGISQTDPNNKYIGLDAANNKWDLMNFKSPMERGIIKEWEEMKIFCDYCFNLLKSSHFEDCRLVCSEPVNNPKENRMKICEYLMENCGVAKLLLINQSVLSLYNSAKTNGIMIDSGHSNSFIVPIHEGYTLHSNVNKLDLGGLDIQEYLASLLNEITRKFSTRKSMDIIHDVIKNHCYFSLDSNNDINKVAKPNQKVVYTLPDGEKIPLTNELFKSPEILFNPKIMGVKNYPLEYQLKKTIENLDLDLKSFLSHHIHFAGGTSLIKNFPERFKKEFLKIFSTKQFAMPSQEKNINSAWLGGSLISTLSRFQSDYITKKEFEENGSIIVQRKCFY